MISAEEPELRTLGEVRRLLIGIDRRAGKGKSQRRAPGQVARDVEGAITVEQVVAGCATGATHGGDVEEAARFSLEVAKSFTSGACAFYDAQAYERLVALYGGFERFQTLGKA